MSIILIQGRAIVRNILQISRDDYDEEDDEPTEPYYWEVRLTTTATLHEACFCAAGGLCHYHHFLMLSRILICYLHNDLRIRGSDAYSCQCKQSALTNLYERMCMWIFYYRMVKILMITPPYPK